MDYAEAALDAHDPLKVQHLVHGLIGSPAKNSRDSRTAKLHWLLGQAMLSLDDNEAARDQFVIAVATDPTFENLYALSQAYLAMLDKDNAAKFFKKMLAEFGDTAQIHMEFGLAYGNADSPKKRFRSFKRRLPETPNFLTPITRSAPLT
jgi:hypothetical protein